MFIGACVDRDALLDRLGFRFYLKWIELVLILRKYDSIGLKLVGINNG